MQEPKNWVVMFVDIVGSTELKYTREPAAVASLIQGVFASIRDETKGERHIKFTGDGAMVIFNKDDGGCKSALLSAERILQAMDRANLNRKSPWIHVRIGVATGECYEVSAVAAGPELIGKTADLAARLCSEADVDSVLIDRTTKENSAQPSYRFELCSRRLSLKGVPIRPSEPDNYYYFKTSRFLKPPKQEHYSKGLLALYPDRLALSRDFTPIRLAWLAKPGSTILVAGRTLIYWTELDAEMRLVAKEKDLRFHFVISSDDVLGSSLLEEEQLNEMRRDLPKARLYFLDLVDHDGERFQLRETDHLIFDGATCAEVLLPGETQNEGKLIVLQDINAAAGDAKACFLLACTCNGERNISCMAHGLYDRTELIFENSKPPLSQESRTPLERILRRHREGGGVRNNQPTKYAQQIKAYFPLIKEGKLDSIPAPLCVQMQISSTCSTHCRMCDHWNSPKENELRPDEWFKIFKDLAEFGVRSVIFSGGEPLMRKDIAALLESAHQEGLKIGMLTNGTMDENDSAVRSQIIDTIRERVEWVAISVDGTSIEDRKIRNPIVREDERISRLKAFCLGLANGPKLSATVTLQKENIDMDFKEACDFIRKDLGIPQVNFKLATGAWKALKQQPAFLLSERRLKDLEHFLWNNPLPQEEGNNFDYLRRSFANGVFSRKDATEGAPTRSFYEEEKPQCHTPFLFSLIDSDGDVYPCCHLYRDNHSLDSSTSDFRDWHRLGNVRTTKFADIWNGEQYQSERRKLQTIEPNKMHFLPCGECTRHCQHNLVLTRIYREYEKDPNVLDELPDGNPQQQPVWF